MADIHRAPAAGNHREVAADNRAPRVAVEADNRPAAEAADSRSAAVVVVAAGSRQEAVAEDSRRPEAAGVGNRREVGVDTRQEAGVVGRSFGLPEIVSA
jgi:hypothetical protein